MRCSLSGEICTFPMVSVKTGHVYERRVIEKALQNNGKKCPHTGVKLELSDLVPVKYDNAVEIISTPQKTDVGSILQHVQNEWDSRAIEVFELRKALQRTRQELATALYRVDAAHRVIAKLREERNHSEISAGQNGSATHDMTHKKQDVHNEPMKKKQRVAESGSSPLIEASLQPRGTTGKGEMEPKCSIDTEGCSHLENIGRRWPNDLLNKVQKLGLELMTARKGRVMKESWARTDEISSFDVTEKCSTSSKPSHVSCIKLGDERNAFVGLTTGCIKTIDCNSMTITSTLDDYEVNGEINCLWWDQVFGTRIASGGKDGVVRLWNWVKWKQLTYFEEDSEIVGLEQHMEGSVALIGRLKGWTWRDLTNGKVISQCEKLNSQYSHSTIHPDGMMFATACTDGPIEIWDVNSMQCVNHLGEKGEPAVSLAMSEKGYYMTSCRNDVIEMWDLRKPAVVGTIGFENKLPARGVALDGLGEFGCAVSSESAVLFAGKKKPKVFSTVNLSKTTYSPDQVRNGPHSRRIGLAWGDDAKWVLIGTGGPSSSIIKLSSSIHRT